MTDYKKNSKNFALSRREALKIGGISAAIPAAIGAVAWSSTQADAQTGDPVDLSRVKYYQFMLGSFEVTALLDGTTITDGPHPIFGQDQDPETVAALMRENFLPADKAQFYFQPMLVNTGTKLILFDAGNGDTRPGTGLLTDAIEAAGYSAGDITDVVITHMHPDHINGLMIGGEVTFPNANYITGRAEFDFWTADERMSGGTEGVASIVTEKVKPLAERFTFLEPGQDADGGVTAVDAFGHTPGHMAYMLENGGKQLLLMADTTNHYVASLQKPEWHVRFDMDKEKAGQTRKRILDMAATDRIPIMGYHMPFPGIGYIETKDSGFRWVPVSYQLDL
jgi:glyoxylase-like metal-dependent hydrolase (beta-lactamase superfamily II)